MAIPSRASRPGTFFITNGTYNRHHKIPHSGRHAFTRANKTHAERRYRSAEGAFFITTVRYNRSRIFQVPRNAELFLKTHEAEVLAHNTELNNPRKAIVDVDDSA